MPLRDPSIMETFKTCTVAGMDVLFYFKGVSLTGACSLLVEPRQAADATPSGDVRQLFSWTNRSQVSQQPVQVS
jgi:hypothetical protein